MIRILVFYQYFGTPKGKWSTRIYELTRRWINKGHKVTVVTSPYEKSDIQANKRIERQNIEGIDLIVINYPDSNLYPKFKRILNFLMFSLYSMWFALKEPCDVVIASSGPVTVGVPALLAKWFRRKPFIFEVRDLWPQGAVSLGILRNKAVIKLAFWFERLCYKNSDHTIGCSPGMTQNIEKRYPEVKTSVISNASDISLFKNEDGSSFDSFNKIGLFIYAGSLGAMDDVDTVVEAAKILKDRRANDIIIEIIGDGADREMLEDKSKIYELDNVRFSGLLPKTEVVKRLKQATATFVCFKPLEVLNTVSPNKMFDSFAAGIPIIQNTTGWIKEYVSDKKCGINVPPEDPEKMADAIMKLHNEKEFRNKLAENAFKSAVDDFDRDKLADKYLRIIDSVIK